MCEGNIAFQIREHKTWWSEVTPVSLIYLSLLSACTLSEKEIIFLNKNKSSNEAHTKKDKLATCVFSLASYKHEENIENIKEVTANSGSHISSSPVIAITPKYFAPFYNLSLEWLTENVAIFSPDKTTYWTSFIQPSTVVLCLFLQTARLMATKQCFLTIYYLNAILGLFWVVLPREDVSPMEHGVVLQPCVPVGFKYALHHNHGICLFRG